MSNLLKEITTLSNAYQADLINLETYYALCDVLIALHKLELKAISQNSA
jgi:hypothetical protein